MDGNEKTNGFDNHIEINKDLKVELIDLVN